MQYSPEMYQFVLKNATLIEKAYTVLLHADERVMQAISQYTRNYVGKYFEVTSLYGEDKYVAFLEHTWKLGSEKEWKAQFQFWYEGKNSDDSYWVNILTGAIPGALTGFYFYPRNCDKKNVKAFLHEKFEDKKMRADGFRLREDGMAIVYPVLLKTQELIDMIAENVSQDAPCFSPIKQALDKIIEKKDVFNELAEEALELNGVG